MGHSRDQMEQAMLVRGFSPVTGSTYAYWMRRFVKFFRRAPIDLGLEEIRAARKKWNVYSKPSFVGPEHVVRYLGRYTHRIAISNGRLLAHEDGEVSFRYTDRASQRARAMTLPADQFLRRFLLHALPLDSCASATSVVSPMRRASAGCRCVANFWPRPESRCRYLHPRLRPRPGRTICCG